VNRGACSTTIIPVLIEPIEHGEYRASGGPPFAISVQGASREEALDRLQVEIEGKLNGGAVLVPLEVGPKLVNPWLQRVGMFRDNPLFDAWRESIAEYRRCVDQDSDTQ
jgi:predicted RNase H-like HicB family nuclease